MFIGKDYDDSLWCMLVSDKKNRKRIFDLIRELPEEVLESARRLAKSYLDEDADEYDEGYYDVDPRDPNVKYYVGMEDDDGCITIQKSLVVKFTDEDGEEKETEEQAYEFMILPLNEDKLDSLEDLEFDDSVGWLGSLTFGKAEGYDYDIREKKSGYAIRRAKLMFGERVEIPSFTKIDLNNIPQDLNVEEAALSLRQH